MKTCIIIIALEPAMVMGGCVNTQRIHFPKLQLRAYVAIHDCSAQNFATLLKIVCAISLSCTLMVISGTSIDN